MDIISHQSAINTQKWSVRQSVEKVFEKMRNSVVRFKNTKRFMSHHHDNITIHKSQTTKGKVGKHARKCCSMLGALNYQNQAT